MGQAGLDENESKEVSMKYKFGDTYTSIRRQMYTNEEARIIIAILGPQVKPRFIIYNQEEEEGEEEDQLNGQLGRTSELLLPLPLLLFLFCLATVKREERRVVGGEIGIGTENTLSMMRIV